MVSEQPSQQAFLNASAVLFASAGRDADTWTDVARRSLRINLHCTYGSTGLTAIILVIGVMNLRKMAVVTAANIVERLAPADEHAARAIGVVAVGAGLFLIAQAF